MNSNDIEYTEKSSLSQSFNMSTVSFLSAGDRPPVQYRYNIMLQAAMALRLSLL